MQGFRLFFLDDGGHSLSVVFLEAQDDEAAIALAEQERDGAPTELWLGARRVKSFPVDRGRWAPPAPLRPKA